MNIFKSKKEYDNMPVPFELNNLIEKAVSKAEYMKAGKSIKIKSGYIRAGELFVLQQLFSLLLC